MNTESAQKEKLKRLKEGKTDLTKLTLERKKPPPVVSRTTARKSCSVTSSTNNKPTQKSSEVGADFSGQSVDFKPEKPEPIAQLPIEVKSQPDANYLQSIEERKRERKQKQAERFKRKRLEKKRELIESMNSPVSIDDKKDDILCVSTINAIDKSEVKKSDTPNVQKSDTPNVQKSDTPNVKKSDTPNVQKSDTPNVQKSETPNVKKSDTPNIKDIESTAPKSELEKKVWDNIIKDLEDLDKDQVQDVCSEEISPEVTDNVAIVNEMTEKETVQAMIMELEEEEPSDWEDREPLEAEIVEEDEGDDAGENEIHRTNPEGSSEDCVVLLSSDDESNTDKEPKKLKEIPIDQNKVGESTKEQNQKDLSVSPATEDVAHHTTNANIVDDSEVRYSDVSESDAEGVLQLEDEDDVSDTENMKDTALVDESNPKELEGVGRTDSVSEKAVDTKDDKQEDNGGEDLLKNPGEEELGEGNDDQDCNWEGEAEGEDGKQEDQEWPEGDDQEWPEIDEVQHDDQEWPEIDEVQHDDQEWPEIDDEVQHDDQEWPEGDDVQHDDQEWPEDDGQNENQEWVEEEEQGTQQDGQSAQEVGDEDLVAESAAADMDLEDEVKIDDRNPVDGGPLEDYQDGQGENFQDVDENVDQTTTEGDKDKENSEDLEVTITTKDCHKSVGDKPNQKADGAGMKVHTTTTTSTDQPEVVEQSDGNLSTVIVAEANQVEAEAKSVSREKPSSPKAAKKLDSNKLMKSVQDKQSGELGNIDSADADSVHEDQKELEEEGEINFHLLGQGPSQKLQIVEEKSRENGSVSSIASPVVSASDVSSLAESQDSQMDESSVPDKNVASLGLESAETKFDLLFKSTGTSNPTVSETLNDLELSTPAKGVLTSTSNAVETEVESKANGTRANAEVALILTEDDNTSVDHDDVELTIVEDAPTVSESIHHFEGGEEIVKKSEEQVNDMETTEITSVNATETARESTISEGTDDIRLQLDFSSSDEEKADKISSTISEPSSSLIGESLTSTLPKTNQVSTKNFVEKDKEQKKETSAQVTDGVPEVTLDDKGERKDQENTSRKRSNDVNLEVFVWEKSPKKAKHDEESEVEDAKVSLEAEDTEEHKEFKVPTLPKLMTMHDLENVIRERVMNYVEECNKTIVDAQNERINQLEKQLERWKKRATFLESQVKEAESELEIYKTQLSVQNKVTATTSNVATYSNTESSTSKPTSNLVGTLTTGTRKSTTTPAMSMSTTSTSLTMSRNILPPTSISVSTSSSKPTTAVPLQLIANTSLTPVKKPTTAPKTTSGTTGPKSSATVIDLTEEEEDKSGNKNASVISSPNRTVALKPNAVKSGSGARSILQSPSGNSSGVPVSIQPMVSSGQMVTLPMMPGTSISSMVQLIPSGSATINSTLPSGVRLTGHNANIRSPTFPNQTGPQVAYLLQGGTNLPNQRGVGNSQLFTLPGTGGIIQNNTRPGQMPTFLLMRNPLSTSNNVASRMPRIPTTMTSTTVNTIPVGGGGLSISLSRPQAMAQPTATRPKQAMTVNVRTTKAPIPSKSKTHPAELPSQPNYPAMPSLKLLPPRPSLKISKVANGIVLSWNMTINATYADIISYQLYAYQETSLAPNPALWKKVGDVKALPLPMACTLTQFVEGNRYYFAVRAVDKHDRIGPFSEPTFIMLPSRH